MVSPQIQAVPETSTNSETHLMPGSTTRSGGGPRKETTVDFYEISKEDTDKDEGDAGTKPMTNLPGTAYDIHQ